MILRSGDALNRGVLTFQETSAILRSPLFRGTGFTFGTFYLIWGRKFSDPNAKTTKTVVLLFFDCLIIIAISL